MRQAIAEDIIHIEQMINTSSAIKLLDLAINSALFQHRNIATQTAHFFAKQFKPSGILTDSQAILEAEKERRLNHDKNKSLSVKNTSKNKFKESRLSYLFISLLT